MSKPHARSPREDFIVLAQLSPRRAFTYRHKGAITLAVVSASVATCVGIGALAGSAAMSQALGRLCWPFLLVMLAAHVVSYAGYAVAHHHILNRSELVSVDWGRGARLMIAGFGAWSISGGFEFDRHALEWHGSTQTDAGVSATVLSLLELILLVPAAWLCALLLVGDSTIGKSETVPWLIGVPLGVIGMAVLVTHARGSTGIARWTGARARLVAGLQSTFALLRQPDRGPIAAGAIAVYWAADITALWAALQFVSTGISLPRLILGYASGYVLTRRALPFAGAIVIEAMMVVSLVWVGVPLAASVVAVLTYRLSDFTCTLGGALFASSALERAVLSRR